MSNPNHTSLAFVVLGRMLTASQNNFAKLSEPHLTEWLDLQTRLEKIDAQDASQEFTFDGFDNDENPKALLFKSEDWDEYWAYGGHERHYGRTVSVPLDFIDNPQTYRDEATRHEEEREAALQRYEEASKRDRVARLEKQLQAARKEAGL